MFRQFIDKVSGADVYLVASLLIFFLFFLAVAVWLVKADRAHLKEMSEKPLDDKQ